MGKKPIFFNETDDSGEGDAEIGEEVQFEEEEGEANIGAEPIFDEVEEVQEEDVEVGEEPQFDEVETMEEDLVNIDTGALLMQQCLCAERQQFEEEDQAETGDELQLDGEEMANKDWVEGDVGPLLMVQPAVITIIDDVKPEIVEEKCYSAPKFDKEVVLGRGNTTEIGRGDTAKEQGTTMVERPVCFTPRAAFATITNVDEQVVDENLGIKTEETNWLRNNVFQSPYRFFS
ncbi:hypothetical protein LWI29_031165 [Acer saccharum]|uniref:Uncharacterized protein n=1 Tax=Acer saccharum TaxID=4024 RepID=A0AA39VTD0_ACESA|nr:hypothetical protein LWI29_031165 [Acer saccharum]